MEDSSRMESPSAFQAAARGSPLLIGVVHLRPLAGSPRHRGEAIEEIAALARRDAEAILEAGFDGYILENFGDAPFFGEKVPPHVVAAMTRIALELPRCTARRAGEWAPLVGVNVLRNDPSAALAVAAACGLQFIRVNVHVGAMVTDQGIVEGRAASTTRERALIAPGVAILADVRVKHAIPLGSGFDLRASARDTAYRGLADGLIVTGPETGAAASLDDVELVREAVPDRPVFVGSGVRPATVREVLRRSSGVIVGSSIKEGGIAGRPVDPTRARELVREARG